MGNEPPDWHRLSTDDLRGLGMGTPSPSAMRVLREARLSKHKILVEAIRRFSGSDCADAWELLARVQARRSEAVDYVLGSPQAGAWAVDSLSAALTPEVGYLTALAVVAAVRAAEPFDLKVSADRDTLVFPGLGTLWLPEGTKTVLLRSRGDGVQADTGEWTDVPRMRVVADGLALDVALESDDPHLDRYGTPVQQPDRRDLVRWRTLLDEAWRIVVATDLQVIVPLEQAPGQKPASATSGWAPGAVGLGLPDDAVTLAETLVHEYRHCVLGLVEDIVPLVDPDSDVLCYAPWRSDPRPPGGLLHGCFAHLAVAAFWRRQREIGPAESEPEAQRQFAHWRQATGDAVNELLKSEALTEAGHCLAEAMRDTLAPWQDEPVPHEAVTQARASVAEHRLNWRLANLQPDENAIDSLVEAWQTGKTPRMTVPTRIVTGQPRRSDQRAWVDLALAATPVVEPIEVAYAVCAKLHRLGFSPSPQEVLGWVAAHLSTDV
jgi:HEXXH motif-containing protein